ncbi:MAG: hypothetical protein LBP32_08050 [Spirochaetaceae bacterium]|nr:hypothetical protein [Spirochaetaceae bacterium]
MAVVLILPIFVAGIGFARDFWVLSWPLVVLLLLILAGINLFYFSQKTLFFLLEREDWPALAQYLEDRVLRKGRYAPHLVRLLANTYLVLSDTASVAVLERKTAAVKPRLVTDNALIFGVARILSGDAPGAAAFFRESLDSGKSRPAEWVRWYYGFSLLLDRRFQAAGEQFTILARESRDAALTGLSAFFLAATIRSNASGGEPEFMAAALEGRDRVRKSFPSRASWDREAGKTRTEVHTAVLTKYIREASGWLYAAP